MVVAVEETCYAWAAEPDDGEVRVRLRVLGDQPAHLDAPRLRPPRTRRAPATPRQLPGRQLLPRREGVLRLSLGCFLFFFVMFLSTVRTRKTHDRRNSWHSEWWPAKIVLWMGFTVVPFFLPSPLIQLYGKIAHFGAGAFLVI